MGEILLGEMAPRDGMQVMNRACVIPLELRARLINELIAAGLPYVEIGSFVSSKVYPCFDDMNELCDHLQPGTGELGALVPNRRHYERFKQAANLTTVALFVSASEEYSQKNTRMSLSEALEEASAIADVAHADGFKVRVHVSYAFTDKDGEGDEPPVAKVINVCRRLSDAGCQWLALADTDGRATPRQIETLLEQVSGAIGLEAIGVHLHDRFGLGILNADAALRCGVRRFDSAVGGIGGNFKAGSGAFGNVATGELFQMLRAGGRTPAIDEERLIEAGTIVRKMTELAGQPPPPSKYLSDALAHRPSSP